MVNLTASPSADTFLTQDTYRGSLSRTSTLNYYAYCAGNPISYTDPSGHAAWAVAGAALGAYDGYKYAKNKNLKGWKKAAAIVARHKNWKIEFVGLSLNEMKKPK